MSLYFYLLPYFILNYFKFTQSADLDVELTTSIANFGDKLYNVLTKEEEKGGNLIFSPYSVHAVLSLLYSGSSGTSATVLSDALQLPGQEDASAAYRELAEGVKGTDDVTLSAANKIYAAADLELLEDFKSRAVVNYDADIENVDFRNSKETAAKINEWVEEKTNRKIRDIISADDLTPDTQIIIVNSLYFLASWEYKFFESGNMPFKSFEKGTYDTPTITQSHVFEYAAMDDFQFIRLPYENGKVSLAIVLPKTNEEFADVERKLTTDKEFFDFRREKTYLKVIIPKFKIESTIDMKSALSQIGLASIFEHIDVSNMAKNADNSFLGSVVQKVFIEVNENGTESAAATRGVIGIRTLPGINFIANRPFLFYLEVSMGGRRHVLFQGRVTEPEYK